MDQDIFIDKNRGNKRIFRISIIVFLLALIAVLAYFAFFSGSSKDKSDLKNNKNKITRTIMIYMSPNNLEYESGIATSDLESIYKMKNIDLDNINVLVYTGGTKSWLNDYVSNQENGLFKLTKNGFEKINKYPRYDMGDSETLQDLLDYAYENFKTDKYDLILYGHGSAVLGAVYDDFTLSHHLELEDLEEALYNSKFNQNNKLELVIFRSCLNGTIEVADLFSNYADYLIASEEVSYGHPLYPVLGFIGSIKNTDDTLTIGKKFINDYAKSMNELSYFDNLTYTYSMVDLSKTKKVVDGVNDFFKNIDLNTNIAKISKIRYDAYQYAYTSMPNDGGDLYDTVDLYSIISELKKYSKSDGDKLLKNIDEFIVYNKSNEKSSKGISIFFPQRNNIASFNEYFKSVYSNLDNFVDYDSFINKYLYLKDKEDSSLAFTNNLEKRNDEYYFELTSDQKKNFGEARYIVFEKTSDNLYRPVISSNEYKLEGNVIKTKLDNKIVKITDTIANESVYLPVTINKNGKTVIPVTINNTKSSDSSLWSIENGMFYIGENNNKIDYQIVLTSKEKAQGVSGAVLGKDDFTSLDFPYSSYNILDENGNYKENWDKNKTLLIFEVKQNGFKLERESLDKNKEYYIVFRITDVYGNVSYTKLLKM